MQRPTRKQRRLFRRWKIPVPSTRQACSTLITYILHGDGKTNEAVVDRIRFIRGCYARFVGSRVKVRSSCRPLAGREGTVAYLRTRPQQELDSLCVRYSRQYICPLAAVVLLDDERCSVALSDLRIIIPADQRTFF